MENKKIKQLQEIVRKEVINLITEAKRKKLKKKKKSTMEGITVESSGGVGKDEVGKFWVVLNPLKGANKENIVFETDLFNFAEKVSNKGVAFENIRAIVREQSRAKKLSEKFLREREAAVFEARNKAEEVKRLKAEVIGKVNSLREKKKSTIDAVKAIDEKRVNENKNKRK